MAVNVRAAASRDLPQLLALVRRYWEFEQIEGFEALPIEMLLQRLLGDPRLGTAWVAEADGALIGYLVAVMVLSLEHRGVMAEIDECFVLPEARARGVGARLLETAEAALAARGCVRVQLQLGVGNAAARAFYEHRGYQPRDGYQLLEKALSATPARPAGLGPAPWPQQTTPEPDP